MTKRQEVTIHIGFWILFIGMNTYFNWVNKQHELTLYHILHNIFFPILEISIFYINYSFICPKTIPNKKWVLLIFGQLFLILLFPLLRHLLEEVIIHELTGKYNYNEKFHLSFFYFYDNSYYVVRIILFSLVFYFIKNIWTSNQRMNDILLQKKQAEIQNLKNQLSPHFLFNTLNSFYADLMDSQPKVADDMLKLSDMLRYVTYEKDSDEIYLEKDIQFIHHYIDLFSRRFDNNLAIEFQVNEYQEKTKITSLLLIHFVENALKHGITNDASKPVKIALSTDNSTLYFHVHNHYIKNDSYDIKGIGYKNIRQRLAYLFPKNHILNIKQTEDIYQVTLTIPLLH